MDQLESLHLAGYIYNDLKLDNILVDHNVILDHSETNIFRD